MTYTAVQLGALEILAWEAIVAGDLRSRSAAARSGAGAQQARKSDPGTLNQGGNDSGQWDWVEMELGSGNAASPDQLETSLADLRFPTRSARRWKLLRMRVCAWSK